MHTFIYLALYISEQCQCIDIDKHRLFFGVYIGEVITILHQKIVIVDLDSSINLTERAWSQLNFAETTIFDVNNCTEVARRPQMTVLPTLR